MDINFYLKNKRRSSNANEKLINSESTEDIPVENPPSTSSPRIRNRYLKRVGVGVSDDIEDEQPLLNDN